MGDCSYSQTKEYYKVKEQIVHQNFLMILLKYDTLMYTGSLSEVRSDISQCPRIKYRKKCKCPVNITYCIEFMLIYKLLNLNVRECFRELQND
jgi:hypothetical protein